MFNSTPFTISYGDDPESLDPVLDILRDCGAFLEVEIIATGEDLYRREIKEGILPESYISLNRTKLLLKAFTRTPKDSEYIGVMEGLCQKFGVHTKLQYLVGENSAGVGIITESELKRFEPQHIAEVCKASLRLGGRSFAYAVDDLRLMIEKELEEYPSLAANFINTENFAEKIADFDVVFVNAEQEAKLHKAIKPKFGCNIFLGNGFAFFEADDDYNKNNKGLLLAAAMVLKYSGQNDAAWAVYNLVVSP